MGTLPPTRPKNIFLTGTPGCGKTTAILRLAALLKLEVAPSATKANIAAAGFYTEEIREQGRRVGFSIRTLHGESGVLSHVNIKSPHRVSKYGVDVPGFERLAVPALSAAAECRRDAKVILIDEIGKMEAFSREFLAAVEKALDGEKPVVATISRHGGGAIQKIRRRPDAQTLLVTESNRDDLPDHLFRLVTEQ